MSRTATNITVIDQALVSGTNFITGLVLARILGIDAYGLFILLAGVTLFASSMQNAIIISPMMVHGPSYKKGASQNYYQTTAILQTVLTLVFFLLILIIGTILNNTLLDSRLNNLILPLALATSGFLLQEYYRKYFFSVNKTIQALVNDSLSYGIQLISIIAVHYFYGIEVESCLYIMAITSFIAVIHGTIISGLFYIISKITYTNIKDTIAKHWAFGKWLIARNMTYWLSTQMVIYMTGIFLSISAVGAMGAARNIVGIINILFLALNNFATPRASKIYASQGINGLSKYMRRLSLIGGGATASIAFIASIAPEFWLNLVYSTEYA
ncbi:MAG: hypothetical protein KAS04_07055, partial [Candidatus Aenigmarchaeota archaeon]|nr:hypothetical protein [Candidatus Aenigmarchaeota archaeon]